MLDDGLGSREVLDKAVGADYVEAMYAKTLEEAKECCRLLEEGHIPARFEDDADLDRGVAILVPESRLVEASELLAARVQQDSVDVEDDEVYDEDDVEDVDADDDDLDDDDDEFEDDADDDDDDEPDEDEEF